MSLLALIPTPILLGGAVAAILTIAGTGAVYVHSQTTAAEQRGYDRGHAEYTTLQADMAAKALASTTEQRNIEHTRAAAQQEAANESERLAMRDRTAQDAQFARTAGAGDGVQRDVATIAARSGAVRSDPGAAAQCTADIRTLTSVLAAGRRVVQQLGRDADAELDDARRRGIECAAWADALTAKP